jgi:hypothetical protein
MKKIATFVFFIFVSLFGQRWYLATDSAPWGRRAYHASVVFNHRIYLLGGEDGETERLKNDVWYSSDGINWVCATDSAPWSPRENFGAIVFDNALWIVGWGSDVWYSSDGINWVCATDSAPWGMRVGHTSVVFDGKMWVIGGAVEGPRNDVWYSSDGINWYCAIESAPWVGRCLHTSVVFDGKMWVIGGYRWDRGTQEERNDVWYSSDGINWYCATPSAEWGQRSYHTSVVFDGKMWVIGGDSLNRKFYRDVWYSSDGINWYCATPSAEWGQRSRHTSVVFDGKMWILGGGLRLWFYNDVWYSTGLGIEETQTLTQPLSPTPTLIYLSQLSQFFQQLRQPIILLDITGRKIATLRPGANNIQLSPGIYFLLDADERRSTRKLVLIK